jgi:hypothetical protein
MPRLGLGLGVGRSIGGGLVPSPSGPDGIPVTTQNLIIDFGPGDSRNGTYINQGNNASWCKGNDFSNLLQSTGVNSNPTWTFWDEINFERLSPSNPSTDPTFIPTSGWTPPISITSAD